MTGSTETEAVLPTNAPGTPGGEAVSRRPPVGFSRRRYHEVDLLRLVAALGVVGFHYLFFVDRTNPLRAHTGLDDPGGVFHYGSLGVPVFFIISGFVILNSAWNRTPSGFLSSRIGRLYPLFWVACTITAVVMAIDPTHVYGMSIRRWLLNLTMFGQLYGVDNVDGVYWTLTVELAFYLMVLAFVKFGITANRTIALCIGWMAVAGLSLVAPAPPWLNRLLVPHWACYFVAGMLFALIARDGWRRRYALPLLPAYALCLVMTYRYFAIVNGNRYHVPYNPIVLAAVITAVFALFIALCSGLRLPGARWMGLVGGLTYPLYLVHANIGYVGLEILHHRIGLNSWLTLALVLAAAVGLAWLLHVTVENRFARPLARLIDNTWISLRCTARTHRIPILSRD